MTYVKKIFALLALSICALLSCAAANAATLTVHNETDKAMSLLYISPTWADIFRDEDEQLGDGYIAPGETARVHFERGDECNFDLRAVFVDGTPSGHDVDRYGVNLCRVRNWYIWK